jgi:hypothetical protein
MYIVQRFCLYFCIVYSLCSVYWHRKNRQALGGSLLVPVDERVYVSPKVSIFPPTLGPYARQRIVVAPVVARIPQIILRQNPTVAMVGEVKHDLLPATYSPYFRFVYALSRTLEELPPCMTETVEEKYWALFAQFDMVCGAAQLPEALDLGVLTFGVLPASRVVSEAPLDQDIDYDVLVDFGKKEEQAKMVEIMSQVLRESVDRICKCPVREGVRKVAHMIKGSSIQIGARALYFAAAKLEKSCMPGFTGEPEEIKENFCLFMRLIFHFLDTAEDIVKEM